MNEQRDPIPTTELHTAATDALPFLTPSARPDSLGRIGHYEILAVIGRGGMGAVLKAHDEQLQRVVALKVMLAALMGDPAARQRFAREARLAAAVTHDNLVPIFAVEEEGPVPYLVMPLIAGHSLQQEIDTRGPLPAADVVRIGMQIAEGLEAAHRHDLIHRDIKPANILLEDGTGHVKITDFGLARAADDASITQTGAILGTPMYMSPEQAEGKKVDHRSDLFSFGSVLYSLCTGRPPFQAKGTLAVLRRVCDSEPRPVRDINPDIPGWLDKVILKLLEKHRADRYQTAGEVAAALRDHLAERSKPSQPAAPRTEKLKPPARHETIVAPSAGERTRRLHKKPAARAGKWIWAAAALATVLVPTLVLLVTEATGTTHLFQGERQSPDENAIVNKDAAGPAEPGKEMPDELIGSWKTRTSSPFGEQLDIVNTYNKDGSYREQLLGRQGRAAAAPGTGRWLFRDGEIHQTYDTGQFQRATVTWIDNDTIDLHLVETRPPGPLLTFRYHRHTDPINPKGPDAAQKENQGPIPPLPGPLKDVYDSAEKRYRAALAEKGPKHIDTLLALRDMAQILVP